MFIPVNGKAAHSITSLSASLHKPLMSSAMTESGAHALADFFNNVRSRPWVGKFAGPALSLCEEYRKIELDDKLGVEYLHLGDTNAEERRPPNKNHVVFVLPFKEPFIVERDNEQPVPTFAARLSMDLTKEDRDMEAIDKDHLENAYIDMGLGSDYYPGTLYVKLLQHDGMSQAAKKTSTFANMKITMLGEFVDFLVEKKLHQMSFLGSDGAWKGCRDFMCTDFLPQSHLWH
ncbi:hypothetical protein EDD15DRAFT_1137132 [Pisolithus albus]|nr:hypothetical protein EDD15DRAFT_1137132 [Pisolithus albus]